MAKSLKQLIAEQSVDIAGIHVSLAAIGAEDADLSGRISANATLIQSNADSLAALTTSAAGTQSQLDAATSGFTTSIQAVEDSIANEIVRAQQAEGVLTTGLADESAERVSADSALSGRIDAAESARVSAVSNLTISLADESAARISGDNTERDRAIAAEAANSAAISAEVTARTSAVAAEASARAAAVSAEQTRAIAAEDFLEGKINATYPVTQGLRDDVNSALSLVSKTAFCHVLEYDGLLVANEYPFCSGAGVPSSKGFGLPIHLPCHLVGYSVVAVSSAVDMSALFSLEYYPVGEYVTPTIISNDIVLGSSKNASGKYPPEHFKPLAAGNVCVRVKTVSYTPLVADRFRIALYFVFDEDV